MGLYEVGSWERCTVCDVTSDGYNVQFAIDPVGEFRDLRFAECAWSVCRIGADQDAHDLTPGTYPCDLVVDEPDDFNRWHVQLWRDAEAKRPRTFLLPHALVLTGTGAKCVTETGDGDPGF